MDIFQVEIDGGRWDSSYTSTVYVGLSKSEAVAALKKDIENLRIGDRINDQAPDMVSFYVWGEHGQIKSCRTLNIDYVTDSSGRMQPHYSAQGE